MSTCRRRSTCGKLLSSSRHATSLGGRLDRLVHPFGRGWGSSTCWPEPSSWPWACLSESQVQLALPKSRHHTGFSENGSHCASPYERSVLFLTAPIARMNLKTPQASELSKRRVVGVRVRYSVRTHPLGGLLIISPSNHPRCHVMF